MMFLLITCLNQHKIIIENFWLKRNQILINFANDQLISSLKIQTSKSVVSKASSQSAFHRSESSEICKMKWKNLNSIVMLTIILKWLTNQKLVNQFIKSIQFIESLLLVKSSTQVDLNQSRLIQSSKKEEFINIIIIEVTVYRTLVKNKKIKIFFLIISEINKLLSSVEDFVKLNKVIFAMSLSELKKKLSIVYHDFLNVFDREKTMQLSLHWSYDHKIELKDES